MSTPALVVRGVSHSYGNHRVLDDINLVVEQGSLTAILGPSGGGKTTLLRLISGFEQPDVGEIEIAGRVVVSAHTTSVPPEKRGVTIVPQEGSLFPHLTVAGNIAFGLRHTSSAERKKRVADLLDMIGLTGFENRRPEELSGGMQQRVALARALAPSPDLILLDEPFSALDTSMREQVREEVMATLRNAGATAVWVTHDQQEALSTADQVAVMLHGHIAQTADPVTLYRAPVRRDVAEFVGDAVVLRGTVHGSDGQVHCGLGNLPIANNVGVGEVDVLLRPEQLVTTTADSHAHGVGVATMSRFFGHDGIVVVRLPTDELVEMRLHAMNLPQPGDSVAITVNGPVLAFNRL
jgi:iron(III) transport system ATP-binding protein